MESSTYDIPFPGDHDKKGVKGKILSGNDLAICEQHLSNHNNGNTTCQEKIQGPCVPGSRAFRDLGYKPDYGSWVTRTSSQTSCACLGHPDMCETQAYQ